MFAARSAPGCLLHPGPRCREGRLTAGLDALRGLPSVTGQTRVRPKDAMVIGATPARPVQCEGPLPRFCCQIGCQTGQTAGQRDPRGSTITRHLNQRHFSGPSRSTPEQSFTVFKTVARRHIRSFELAVRATGRFVRDDAMKIAGLRCHAVAPIAPPWEPAAYARGTTGAGQRIMWLSADGRGGAWLPGAHQRELHPR